MASRMLGLRVSVAAIAAIVVVGMIIPISMQDWLGI